MHASVIIASKFLSLNCKTYQAKVKDSNQIFKLTYKEKNMYYLYKTHNNFYKLKNMQKKNLSIERFINISRLKIREFFL